MRLGSNVEREELKKLNSPREDITRERIVRPPPPKISAVAFEAGLRVDLIVCITYDV
jgi:hypothetical protein